MIVDLICCWLMILSSDIGGRIRRILNIFGENDDRSEVSIYLCSKCRTFKYNTDEKIINRDAFNCLLSIIIVRDE